MATYTAEFRKEVASTEAGDAHDETLFHSLEIEAEYPTMDVVEGHVRITCEERGVVLCVPEGDFDAWYRDEFTD